MPTRAPDCHAWRMLGMHEQRVNFFARFLLHKLRARRRLLGRQFVDTACSRTSAPSTQLKMWLCARRALLGAKRGKGRRKEKEGAAGHACNGRREVLRVGSYQVDGAPRGARARPKSLVESQRMHWECTEQRVHSASSHALSLRRESQLVAARQPSSGQPRAELAPSPQPSRAEPSRRRAGARALAIAEPSRACGSISWNS